MTAATPPFEPTRLQAWSAIAVGSLTMIATGLQPLILGELAAAGRLPAAFVHPAAFLEILALAAGVAICALWMKPEGLRGLGGLFAVIAMASSALTLVGDPSQILISRALTGLSSGVLIWLTIGMIARRERSEPWAAAFFMIQAVGQVLLAAVVAQLILPAHGAAGAAAFTAGLLLLAGVSAMGLPAAWPDLAGADHGRAPGARGGLALLALFLYFAAVGAAWFQMRPLAELFGQTANVGPTILAMLACQMVGALLAMALAHRLSRPALFVTVSLINLAAYAVLTLGPPPILFLTGFAIASTASMVLGASLFGFLQWADPSRRAGAISATAQFLAASLGPLFGMLLAGPLGPKGGLLAAALCLLAGLAVLAALRRRAATP